MIACDVQCTVKSLKHDRKDFHVRFPVSLGVCCQPLRAGVSGAGPLVIPMSIRKGSTIGCTAQSLLSAKISLDVNLVGQETSFQYFVACGRSMSVTNCVTATIYK